MLNEYEQLWASGAAQALDAHLTNHVFAPSVNPVLVVFIYICILFFLYDVIFCLPIRVENMKRIFIYLQYYYYFQIFIMSAAISKF